MQRVLDRGPPPSVTLTTPEATQDATAASEFQDATAADDDFRWRFSGTTIPDDPKARDQACHHVPKRARPDLCSGSDGRAAPTQRVEARSGRAFGGAGEGCTVRGASRRGLDYGAAAAAARGDPQRRLQRAAERGAERRRRLPHLPCGRGVGVRCWLLPRREATKSVRLATMLTLTMLILTMALLTMAVLTLVVHYRGAKQRVYVCAEKEPSRQQAR